MKRVVLAGGSQTMFVCKVELRDAVGKQFESREILGHAESILKEYSSIKGLFTWRWGTPGR